MKRNDNFLRNKETLDQGNQIFSVGGTPSFRLNRREQTTSNVFPAGCMGSRSGEEIAATYEEKNSDSDVRSEIEEHQEENNELKETSSLKEASSVKEKKQIGAEMEESGDGYVWKRNPLTGQGVEVEQPRGHKRRIKKKLHKWVW